MAEDGELLNLRFSHRSKMLQVRVPAKATLMEVGHQLVSASGVAPHTLRLLLPRAPALLPFSAPHSSLLVSQSGISEGQVVRMMGALPGEIKAVSQEVGNANEKTIIGFSEEDVRAKRWRGATAGAARRLPQGEYIFCDFRTLHLPGVELTPSPAKALEIMHKLASDPGIVAIMNRHRWRVGLMTEMAPVGYVGISSECILGYNKNQGEEISLRLRTDNLKGFRKYESIKLTLLHELAHMVHSNHDANFHALNKQLKEEAISLDWTKSGGHSLGGSSFSSEEEDEETIDVGGVFSGGSQKLGGSKDYNEMGAHSAAALAAVLRLSSNADRVYDDNVSTREVDVRATGNEVSTPMDPDWMTKEEPNPDDCNAKIELEPDDTGSIVVDKILTEAYSRLAERVQDAMPEPELDMNNAKDGQKERGFDENAMRNCQSMQQKTILDSTDSVADISTEISLDTKAEGTVTSLTSGEHQAGSSLESSRERFKRDIAESAGEYPSLNSMQEYTEKVCQRLQVASVKLKKEASSPSEVAATIQSLLKIVRNIKEHPHDEKFKRLRKANAVFQNRIGRFEGAMEVLHAVGFGDGPGDDSKVADYLILKRHDPVLLWLAQTSLEACIS